jgi:hypothetical protein
LPNGISQDVQVVWAETLRTDMDTIFAWAPGLASVEP